MEAKAADAAKSGQKQPKVGKSGRKTAAGSKRFTFARRGQKKKWTPWSGVVGGQKLLKVTKRGQKKAGKRSAKVTKSSKKLPSRSSKKQPKITKSGQKQPKNGSTKAPPKVATKDQRPAPDPPSPGGGSSQQLFARRRGSRVQGPGGA